MSHFLKPVGLPDWIGHAGIWRFTAEYSGKVIPDFTPSAVEPVFGTEPDYTELSELFQIPGFDPEEYVRQQVGAFNRLYNYQIERYYHSAGFKIDADLIYGKMIPSVFTMYNFTSRDLLVIPEVKLSHQMDCQLLQGLKLFRNEGFTV